MGGGGLQCARSGWNWGCSDKDQYRPCPCSLELHSRKEAASNASLDAGQKHLQTVFSAMDNRERKQQTY